MNTLSKLLITACILLPVSASAADAPATTAPGDQSYMGYWKRVDTNNDGVISKDEYLAEAGRRFDEMDTNHDGKVTRDEMDAFHNKMREKMHERFDQMRMMHGGGGNGAMMMTPPADTTKK